MSYDVVVCGAGIAGMAAALQLAKNQFKVAILAPKVQPKHSLGEQYHPRIYAISLASQQFLESLGVWQMMPAERRNPVRQMEVHGDLDGVIVLDAQQSQMSELAYIVESGEIEQALFNALKVYGVPWIEDRIQGYEQWQGEVRCASGQLLQTKLLIGADGARSTVREICAIRHEFKAYGDIGLVAQLNVEKPHLNTAIQWFDGSGVLAFLPLPDTADGHQVSMVWSARQAIADKYLAMSAEELAQRLPPALQAIAGQRLGEIQLRSPMYGFPLTLESSAMVGPGVALVGDAAHRVHPLAGQGLNLGLGDVETLCKVLIERESMRDLNDMRLLQRYKHQRAEAIFNMRFATDGLYRLFALNSPALAMLRNTGLSLVDRIAPLKKYFVRAAAGN
ncbi:FAD-dependent monooxygenase [Oligella urethralis]|uniref:FAD-dependent monooxygenase n=1 Tax=Oligella urethralis TaxID=90245 RepID=UPI00037974BE|nr:FAD-dependent monooxygenase [Oligella urethralis]AVL71725.1 FAD-binding protein [Oligella urethralis]